MKRTDLTEMRCSIAQTLDVLYDPWGALILRDVFAGITRFSDIQEDLGVARNVLSSRLDRLLTAGLLEARPYQEHPLRSDYLLTEKGRDLVPAVLAIMAWGDRWTAGKRGSPVLLRHQACGDWTNPVVACSRCRRDLTAEQITVFAGPGGRNGPGTRVMAQRLPRPVRQ